MFRNENLLYKYTNASLFLVSFPKKESPERHANAMLLRTFLLPKTETHKQPLSVVLHRKDGFILILRIFYLT